MRYRAKPVEVEAHKIAKVGTTGAEGLRLYLDNEMWVTATPAMLSRMNPAEGDYWVIQPDGYIYLNPKAVFERKYEPIL